MHHRSRAILTRTVLGCAIAALLVHTGRTEYPSRNVVIELQDGSSVDRLAAQHQASVIGSSGKAYLVTVPQADLQALASDPAVRFVEPEFEIQVSENEMPAESSGLFKRDMIATLNRSESVYSGNSPIKKMMVKQPAMDLIGCEDDEYEFASGRGIRVAVIDTGMDSSHPALAGRILPGHNFIQDSANTEETLPIPADDPSAWLNVSTVALLNPWTIAILNPAIAAELSTPANRSLGHGTLVAGLIRIIAPDTLFIPLKTFDTSGQASSFNVAKAIRYAADQNVDVINMSFDFDAPSDVIREALDYAAARRVILVASAGNHNAIAVAYPAAHPSVIAVAATDSSDRKSSFSNYGPAVAVAAPGEGLISTYPGGRYALIAGTSFSAALVSGEAALVRSTGIFPAGDVTQRIRKSAKGIHERNPLFALGSGRIRVDEAIGVKHD